MLKMTRVPLVFGNLVQYDLYELIRWTWHINRSSCVQLLLEPEL